MQRLTKREKWLKRVLCGLTIQHGCWGKRSGIISEEFDSIYAEYIEYTGSTETKRQARMSLLAVLKKGYANLQQHLA